MREAALEVALMRGPLAPSLGRRLLDALAALALARRGRAAADPGARDRRRTEERWPTL